jgi:hypothetical protein
LQARRLAARVRSSENKPAIACRTVAPPNGVNIRCSPASKTAMNCHPCRAGVASRCQRKSATLMSMSITIVLQRIVSARFSHVNGDQHCDFQST